MRAQQGREGKDDQSWNLVSGTQGSRERLEFSLPVSLLPQMLTGKVSSDPSSQNRPRNSETSPCEFATWRECLPQNSPLLTLFPSQESCSFLVFFVCFLFFCLFVFLGPHPRHMEVPRLGVESELQLPAYATATAMPDLSCVCDLHHSSWQCWILNH